MSSACGAPWANFSTSSMVELSIALGSVRFRFPSKSYHIGLNTENRVRKDWKVEVWKID